MPLRSTTGCYRCKSKRKKCDETKPQCLRCARNGADCTYEYVPSAGRKKQRTRPAPRPICEKSQKLDKRQPGSTTISESDNILGAPNYIAGLFDYPIDPYPGFECPLDSIWGASSATIPLDPLDILSPRSTFLGSQKPLAPGDLTTGQASLFNALFSLGGSDPTWPSSSCAARSSSPGLGTDNHAPNTSASSYHGTLLSDLHDLRTNTYPPPQVSVSTLQRGSEKDKGDLEGVQRILCPVRLDPNIESNTLPFVLQSYAQWISLAFFEPLKIAQQAKEMIIQHFTQSGASRSRVLLIARLMRMLLKSWVLEGTGSRVLGLLQGEVWRNVTSYQTREWLAGEAERERASAALDNTLELINIQLTSAPLLSTLQLLQATAPVFLAACPGPHPPHLSSILLESGINLRHFATMDIASSVVTGTPLFCRYHVPWSLKLCNEIIRKREDQGLQWLLGIPDQFILLSAYLHGLKEDADAAGTSVDPKTIEQVEEDMKNIPILRCESKDPALAAGRMVVQECWREVMSIYLYMALCGAHALDPRVGAAQQRFMKLVNGANPGRNPDAFLVIPMTIAGVATTKSSDRQTLSSRVLALSECALPNTAGNDSLRIIEDIWARTELEGRVARWEDLREARRRVTGFS